MPLDAHDAPLAFMTLDLDGVRHQVGLRNSSGRYGPPPLLQNGARVDAGTRGRVEAPGGGRAPVTAADLLAPSTLAFARSSFFSPASARRGHAMPKLRARFSHRYRAMKACAVSARLRSLARSVRFQRGREVHRDRYRGRLSAREAPGYREVIQQGRAIRAARNSTRPHAEPPGGEVRPATLPARRRGRG